MIEKIYQYLVSQHICPQRPCGLLLILGLVFRDDQYLFSGVESTSSGQFGSWNEMSHAG